MTDISWTLTTIFVKDIKEYRHNPRQISSYDLDKLADGISKFGLIDKLICNIDFTLIGGHQRLAILKSQKVKSTDVWIPSRELEAEEVKELCVRLNRNHGDFDYDLLANEFDIENLLDWGFHADELGIEMEEKPLKPQKYKIELEFTSLRELEDASNRVNDMAQDFDNCTIKIKV